MKGCEKSMLHRWGRIIRWSQSCHGRDWLPLVLAIAACCPAQVVMGQAVDFAHEVAPVLQRHCVPCHGGTESNGGFSLNTRELLLDAEAVTPGKSNASRMIALIESRDEDEQMPPSDRPRLTAKEIQALRRWIDAGAPWDPGITFAVDTYEPPLLPRAIALPPATLDREHPVDRILDHQWLKRNGATRNSLTRGQANASLPTAVEDAEFARRVYLDLLGLLPTPEELESFLADQRNDKRERLIDGLLDRDLDYAEHWLTFWNDLLRNDYTGTGFITGGRKRITGWLYDALKTNKPYDQFVRELIAPTAASEGFIVGIRWRGEVNSSQTPEIQFAQNISQAMLGINMKCASCHDSFIDRWTLEETYALAQVYATSPLELHRCDKPTGKTATAAWPFPELGQLDPKAPQRERLEQLAKLMTHPDNGRLTRTLVNRIWSRLMGRGIVHPVDAMHTRPFNEDLLDYLANDFAASGYDLRHVIRRICTSQAYQSRIPARQSPQEPGRYIYQGPLPRRMTAEQFMDSVWQLTGAAPTRIDAQVMRVRPNAEPASQPQGPKASARWIWDREDSATAPGGQQLAFRRAFRLEQKPVSAILAITCDNSYRCWINGKLVGADDQWNTVETRAVQTLLRSGENEVMVLAANGASSPNPAGLIVELQVKSAADATQVVATDEQWEWSTTLPNQRGRVSQRASWRPARRVSQPGVWAAATEQLRQAVARGATASTDMVRASLVKNNSLMRALGRPNRDQIVTSRPNELTTLEAIDLANGQLLADAATAGAKRALGTHATSEELTTWLFTFALSRPPTEDEMRLAAELLGEKMEQQAVEDLIWAVLMLPEFQLIR